MSYINKKIKPDPIIFTVSSGRNYLTCEKSFELRNIKCLTPLKEHPFLPFGSIFHNWVECWHKTHDINLCQKIIDDAYPLRESDLKEKQNWQYQTAMLKAYAKKYPNEEFSVIALEKEFKGKIINPKTGRKSRIFEARGKLDGIIKYKDDYFILEHKSTSSATGDYLERLWSDFQIHMYALYARQSLKIPVTGILYNIIQKPQLKQSIGETEEEYQTRLSELIAKSKTGKSSAKRKMPESDDAFQKRLADWYENGQKLLRVKIILDYKTLRSTQQQIWDTTQKIKSAIRYNRWIPNTYQCHVMGRCAYLPICSSNENPIVIENHFKKKRPHSELNMNECEAPAF